MWAVKKKESGYVLSTKVRWRGQGTRFVDIKDRRYKLRLFGNNDEIRGVGILLKK